MIAAGPDRPHSRVKGHPTKCKCQGCRDAFNAYRRALTAEKRAEKSRAAEEAGIEEDTLYRDGDRTVKLPPGSLAVLCWCEKDIVAVSAKLIMQCKTESCGLPGCKEGMGR